MVMIFCCCVRATKNIRLDPGLSEVRKGKCQSISAMGADWQTAGVLSGIEQPGGVPPTYHLGSDSLDVSGS